MPTELIGSWNNFSPSKYDFCFASSRGSATSMLHWADLIFTHTRTHSWCDNCTGRETYSFPLFSLY